MKPFEYVEAKIPILSRRRQVGHAGRAARRRCRCRCSPEESLKHYVTSRRVSSCELFAAEPDIGKPIAMTWDERGRLWICETVDYPNELQPEGKGRDRIRICEDTDGDGRADKFTVFAEKLSIPDDARLPSRRRRSCRTAPETLYLKDTDGDDKADVRKVLFTGWGARRHARRREQLPLRPRQLDLGHAGLQPGSEPATVERQEAVRQFRQGFFRFRFERPDGRRHELEFVRSTNNNTWGLGISEEGLRLRLARPTATRASSCRFQSLLRSGPRLVAAACSAGIADTQRIRPDHRQGPPGRSPRRLHGRRRPCPLHGPQLSAGVLEPHGVRLRADRPPGRRRSSCSPTAPTSARSNAWNLVASDDEWTAPIMAEVGPDGNVWVLDWYNYIVQHNPTPVGFKTGKGNAYETRTARQEARPRSTAWSTTQEPSSGRCDLKQGLARSPRRDAQPSDSSSGGSMPSGCSSSAAEARQHVLAAACAAVARGESKTDVDR